MKHRLKKRTYCQTDASDWARFTKTLAATLVGFSVMVLGAVVHNPPGHQLTLRGEPPYEAPALLAEPVTQSLIFRPGRASLIRVADVQPLAQVEPRRESRSEGRHADRDRHHTNSSRHEDNHSDQHQDSGRHHLRDGGHHHTAHGEGGGRHRAHEGGRHRSGGHDGGHSSSGGGHGGGHSSSHGHSSGHGGGHGGHHGGGR